ncbi:MAG: hypothetical protein JKY50_03715 [Oleispira sp.]|nr:hypothetical protein [Oleispira sp.]
MKKCTSTERQVSPNRFQLCYAYLESKTYDTYTESDNCREFPLLVMELGLKRATGLEAFRNNEDDDFFFIRMAEWLGTEDAERDGMEIDE